MIFEFSGVFVVGKTGGIPFYRNKASSWYLAIAPTGQVYMSVRNMITTKESESLQRSA